MSYTAPDNQILPTLYHNAGPRVDGAKVHFWATRKHALQGARDIGWPANSVSRIHTRFQIGYALNNGIELGFITPEAYRALHADRNGVRS